MSIKLTPQDLKLLGEFGIDMEDCPKCSASRDMQEFYAEQHDRMANTVLTQSRNLVSLQREYDLDRQGFAGQLHHARLLAFAGWFMAALLAGIPLVYRMFP